MGGLEKLDVALAKLLRSEQASKSRVEAAASAAVKLSSAYSEDVVDRLVDFFSETGEDGKLTAFYVVGAVLDMERKALKTHYLADLFATRMKSILDKFYRSSEKEKDQVSKVLGRWKRYKIFDEKKLREWARSSGCCVGLEEKASQEKAEKERKDKEKSKSRRVGFKDDPESPPPARTSRQENDPDRPRLFDKGQGDAARSLLSRLASEKKSTKSDGDVLDLSRKRSFDEDRPDQKRQRIAPPVGSGPPPLGLPMPGVPPQSLPSFPPPPPSFPQTSPRAPPSMQAGARGVPRAVSNAPAPPSMPPMPPPVPPPMPPMPGMSGHPPPAPPPVAPPAPPPVAPPAPPPAPPMPPGPPATTETKSVPTSWGGIPAAVKPTTDTGSDAQQKASGWSSFGGGASKSSSGTAPAATGGWGSYTK